MKNREDKIHIKKLELEIAKLRVGAGMLNTADPDIAEKLVDIEDAIEEKEKQIEGLKGVSK